VELALIRKFEEKTLERGSLHSEIEARYAVLRRDGKTVLQIDTYGRPDRQFPEKVSQSLQLDEVGAKALYYILKDEFNFD